MLAAERRKQILELLETKSAISVGNLSELYDVSEMTIRRDLRYLANEKLLQRVHGGAIASRGRSYEPPYLVRSYENTEQKETIGRRAASLVSPGDSIALDVGTTTLEVGRALAGTQNLTILTSSLRIADLLTTYPGIRLIVSGGILRQGEPSLVGHIAQRTYQEFRVDKAFIGVGGVHLEHGLTEYTLEDTLVKQEIIKRAGQVIAVADSSKLGRTCFVTICPLASVHTLVTDAGASPEFVAELRHMGIDVILT